MIKWLKRGLVVILLIVCCFLAYSMIDMAVSLDHARQEQKTQDAKIIIIKDMLEKQMKGMSKEKIRDLIHLNYGSNYLIKEDATEISVDNVIFEFQNETFKKINFP